MRLGSPLVGPQKGGYPCNQGGYYPGYYRGGYGCAYYDQYRPLRYYGCDYYRPFYGYSYASVYYPYPYVHQFYGPDVYYEDTYTEAPPAYDPSALRAEPPAPEAVTPPTDSYPTLTDPNDKTLVGQGNAAFLAGRYEEARRFYASAMLADERDGYAKFLFALANVALREYDVAGFALRRAILTTPALIEFPVDVRGLYQHPAALDQQIEDLARFAIGHPKDHGAWLLVSYLHYAAGQPDPAMDALNRFTETNADDVAALLRDAIVRVKREQAAE